MFEFFPWSRKVLDDSLQVYNQDCRMSILDMELGGACNMCCVYCDTPRRNTPVQYGFSDIEKLLKEGCFSWLFICGLGEPTDKNNMCLLKRLLKECESNKIKCCMFSNVVNFDEEIFQYIDSDILYPMFKLDGLNPELLTSLYGVEKSLIDKQLENVYRICSHVKNSGKYTNVCASIVPTTKNIDCLPELIDWCLGNGIFPLIGDLEDAGKGQAVFNELKVSEDKLFELSRYFYKVTGEKYHVPICPSVLFGIHIDYKGNIVVDKLSGLSCHWFWLTEPKVCVLAELKNQSSLELSKLIIDNRNKHRNYLKDIINTLPHLVFGGCGGNICDLLDFYLTRM